MKKLYYILSLFLVFSCMNNAEKKALDLEEESVLETETLNVNEAVDIKTENAYLFTEQDIAYQKLQEFYDLNVLKQHHPEFEEDISKQIAELSNSELNLPRLTREIKINNLKQIETAEQLNDSILKLKLSYDLHSEQGTQKDSITAIIKTSTIIIEGKEQKSYKVTFEKN